MNASWWSRAVVLLTLLVGPPSFANNVVGAWSPPTTNNWPLIPIHAVLLPDGRVLTYGTYSIIGTTIDPAQQTGRFKYDVWNPTQGFAPNAHITLDNITLTDIFCSSQVMLPASGSVFLAGGDNWTGTATTNTGNNNSNLFRYTDNTLSRGSNMNSARWYSSSTALTNGEIYIQGGNGGGNQPEIRDLNGNFRLLGVDTSALAAAFPRNWVAPDGRIFGFDSNGVMYYINTTGNGQYTGAGTFSSSYAGWQSSAAMFRPGRILQLGANSSGAATIDINGPAPVVAATQSMASVRKWVSATVLADGRVLATGGSPADNDATNANNTAVVWDSTLGTNGQWINGPSGPPSGSRYRLYHSGALLLPDASVLVMGGGAPGPSANLHGEIYYPSYLYNGSGVFATRPTIVTAPDTLDQGVDFSMNIGTADVRRLTLIKTGSVTHSVNMDQRFIELPFSASSGTLFVEMPDAVTTVPPGYYLLFAFNASGVPSVGKIVRVNIPSNPIIQLDYTATVGGTAGTAFTLACNWNEALVGILGNATTSVNRLGVQCIQVNQAGHWIGAPINRLTTGTATGTAFTKTCAQDSAISGFRGRSSTLVDQLDFACKPLTFAGKVSGTATYLGAVGGTGGTAQGPFDCSTNNPVYSLSGRSGANINAFSMLCRQEPITYVAGNSPPIVINPGNQGGTIGTPVSLQISASDPNSNPLTYSATGLPPGLGIGTTTGLITGTPTTAGSNAVTVSVTDGSDITTVNFTWTIGSPNPLVVNPMPDQPAQLVNTAVTYTATTQNAINPRYKWYFDDGSETAYSSSPSVTHTFTQPTIYWVAVTATDDRGVEQTQTFSQVIYRPLTSSRPAISSNLALGGGRLWVVNQDNDTVSAFNTSNNQKLAEISVGTSPRSVAISPSGEVWVTNKAASTISVIDPSTMTVNRTITLGYGAQPFGIAFAPNGSAAFVALEGAGRVVRLDPVSGSELVGINVGPNPRHVSVSADATKVYVSRFITPPLPGEATAVVTTTTAVGGEVLVLNAGNLTAITTVKLRHSDDLDFENSGAGIPNYLGPVVISNDGTKAWVPSKKDNIKRGTLRSGANLNFQNTVRAISSSIDLATNLEDFGSRIDHDNASMASSAAFDKYGVFMFVALETSREVAVVDAHNHAEFFRINVGRAPQGLAVSADGYRLYVSNFMDRTVGVYDLTQLIDKGQWQVPLLATLQPVATERLTATVLLGKQLFYDARDTRLARDNYMSCASCHNDGGSDGRVWDLTGFGEGLRNTISLRGKSGMGHGFLHWSANFDEIQDFEGQIRNLAGGTGLMSDTQFNTGTRSQPLGDPKSGVSPDLDALAAYLASLGTFARSHYRNPDGTLTADGVAGKAIFDAQNCVQCHRGNNFTISAAANLRDVGTIKQPTSGQRLGAALTGIDVPTLRDLWATAPYLHDGSAAALPDAILAHSGVSLTTGDLSMLAAYLNQIDETEPAPFVPNTTPTVVNPGPRSGATGVATSLQISATDAEGDPLTYSATGLPAGLSISSTTGLISGTPSVAGTSNVTVTVNDGRGGAASTAFTWTIAQSNRAPVVTNPGSRNDVTGSVVNLSVVATDADGDPMTFSATGLPNGLAISSSTGRITGTLSKAGNWNVVVTVRDNRGGTGTAGFKWAVRKR